MTRRLVSRDHVSVELTDEHTLPPSGDGTFFDNNGNPVALAGERVTIEDSEDGGSTTIRFDDKGTGRVCGSCQLCCKLLPVRSMAKGANQRCRHQRAGKGCMIYRDRPWDCRTFTCRWLGDPKATALPRPDRAHYVIDAGFDNIVLDGDSPMAMGVLQVWLDPAFPDAWNTPELRAYMLMVAERLRAATIIRLNERDAFVVFPPPLAADGQWHVETTGALVPRKELAEKVREALA